MFRVSSKSNASAIYHNLIYIYIYLYYIILHHYIYIYISILIPGSELQSYWMAWHVELCLHISAHWCIVMAPNMPAYAWSSRLRVTTSKRFWDSDGFGSIQDRVERQKNSETWNKSLLTNNCSFPAVLHTCCLRIPHVRNHDLLPKRQTFLCKSNVKVLTLYKFRLKFRPSNLCAPGFHSTLLVDTKSRQSRTTLQS